MNEELKQGIKSVCRAYILVACLLIVILTVYVGYILYNGYVILDLDRLIISGMLFVLICFSLNKKAEYKSLLKTNDEYIVENARSYSLGFSVLMCLLFFRLGIIPVLVTKYKLVDKALKIKIKTPVYEADEVIIPKEEPEISSSGLFWGYDTKDY